ncbi:MAG: DUF2809 domain-containing protein [Oculatellaceae cyanobacterium Prado106]|jgi:hypothetical protein|nr:DUF2809 domain-containing protein [Oculatellaceae cyanobacterium Prado106]
MTSLRSPYRLSLLLSIALILPLGYIVRFSQGLGSPWIHDLLGSLAYQIFWVLLVTWLWPRANVVWTAIAVCMASSAIEVLQLWQPPWLQAIRATWPGRLILGNTFTGSDFPPYVLGSLLGWVWVRLLQQLEGKG